MMVLMQKALVIVSTYDRPGGISMLNRLLKSLVMQEEQHFDVLLLECNNFTSGIHNKGDFRSDLLALMREFDQGFPVHHINEEKWNEIVSQLNVSLLEKLSFDVYAGFRNIGLFLSVVLGYKHVLFIDDDEVVEDQRYVKKAMEHIGIEYQGKIVGGVGGYYVNDEGSYHVPVRKRDWWDLLWPKMRYMNRAYGQIGRAHV